MNTENIRGLVAAGLLLAGLLLPAGTGTARAGVIDEVTLWYGQALTVEELARSLQAPREATEEMGLRWRFGGEAAAEDTSGHQRHGEVSGRVRGGDSGARGRALTGFTSHDSQVAFPWGEHFGNGSWTLEMWARDPGHESASILAALRESRATGPRAAWTLYVDADGRLAFGAWSPWSQPREVLVASDPLEWAAGTWYHVAVVFERRSGQAPRGLRLYRTPAGADVPQQVFAGETVSGGWQSASRRWLLLGAAYPVRLAGGGAVNPGGHWQAAGPAAGERDPDEALYREKLARFTAAFPRPWPTPHIAMKYTPRLETIEEDIATLEALGVNTVWARTGPALKAALNRRGFLTVSSGSALQLRAGDGEEGWPPPEKRQMGYLSSEIVTAAGDALVIRPGYRADGGRHAAFEPVTDDPARYWRVLDRTAEETVPADHWALDPETGHLTVSPARPGHRYQALVLVRRNERQPEFFFPSVRGQLRAGLARRLAESPSDIYRPTSLAYGGKTLYMEGGRVRAWWQTYRGVSPEIQAAFEAETGIAFDPEWWFDWSREREVNHPPRHEYLAWMRFRNAHVEALARDLVETAAEHGAVVRAFWGDNWKGMEPYDGFFARTGVQQVTKPVGNAADVRLAMDIPDEGLFRSIRFWHWLQPLDFFPAGSRASLARFGRWDSIRQGMLFRVPDGFEWGGQGLSLDAVRRGRVFDRIERMNMEYKVMHRLLGGHENHRHDLKAYVLTAWGQLRPWETWVHVNNPSSQVFRLLATMPLEVRYRSLAEVAENGLPGDADLVLLFGEPGSSWSGGFHWADQRVAAAVRAHVAAGGGLVAIDAPSHHPDGETTWQLADLLGLDYDGPTDEGARLGIFTRHDQARLGRPGTPPAGWSGPMARRRAHWITATLPDRVESWRAHARVRQTCPGLVILHGGEGDAAAAPLVAVREEEAGRVVYLSGYHGEGYREVFERALYWAGRAEAEMERVFTPTPGARVFFYPAPGLLAVNNSENRRRTVRVLFDPALAGRDADERVTLADALDGETVFSGRAAESRRGFDLELLPAEIRYLRLE